MGIRYEDQCDGCEAPGYPCLGKRCPKRSVKIWVCDRCKNDIDGDVYEVDGMDLCEECLKERFFKETDE